MSNLAIKPPMQFNDPKPLALIKEAERSKAYPIEALGDVLGNAAMAITKGIQTPPEMAAQSVLAAASLAVQPFANAVLDGRPYPLSLFHLTIAESGDRKSAVDRVATLPHKARQRQLFDSYAEEYQRFKNESDAFDISRKQAIEKNKKSGKEAVAMALHEIGLPPEEPRSPTLLSQEPTAEGLVKGFFNGLPSQGLFSDEGGSFFGGHSMKDENRLKSIAILSQFWDGSDINRTRAGLGETMTIKNPRLSAHLMIQPVVAEKIFSDKELTGQGFMARFLVASPKSIAGKRFYNSTDLTFDKSVIRYHSLMETLLRKSLPVDEKGTLTPRTLNISTDAKSLWMTAYNAIETQLAPKMELADIKPTAAKTAEQIIRIAGVLMLVDDPNASDISKACMERAIHIGTWYLQEALRLTQSSDANCDFVTASMVKDWIIDKGLTFITVNDINKNRVAKMNSAKRCREILNLLEDNGWLIRLPADTMVGGKAVKESWRLNRNTQQRAS